MGKKKLFIGAGIVVLLALAWPFGSRMIFAEKPAPLHLQPGVPSRYEQVIAAQRSQPPMPDPNGNVPKPAEVFYKANKDIDQSKLLKPEELDGYVSDWNLAWTGGQRTIEQRMTYKEFFDLGLTTGLRYDIDPARLVWVTQIKYSKTMSVFGYDVSKPIITTTYDAQTGDQIEASVSSQDPHGTDRVIRH